MLERIRAIRQAERDYHEACYNKHKLFEAGSWLHKPVQTVMNHLQAFDDAPELTVLDLGCGVGRNSIPMARTLGTRSGRIVCVDLLETALDKLSDYAKEHGVSDRLELHCSDIGDFQVPMNSFDYIVAVSTLEHVESEAVFAEVLNRLKQGTKPGGILCIIMSTNIEELDPATGCKLEPCMEVNLGTEQAYGYMNRTFAGWELLQTSVKPQSYPIDRNGQAITLRVDCLTYVVQKIQAGK